MPVHSQPGLNGYCVEQPELLMPNHGNVHEICFVASAHIRRGMGPRSGSPQCIATATWVGEFREFVVRRDETYRTTTAVPFATR